MLKNVLTLSLNIYLKTYQEIYLKRLRFGCDAAAYCEILSICSTVQFEFEKGHFG